MGELNTIQKREKLNTVYVVDEEDIVTGANHEYQIWNNYYDNEEKPELLAKINFQNGELIRLFYPSFFRRKKSLININ